MERLYVDSNNQVYGGDRLQRTDGSFDPIAPDRPSPQHQWNGNTWVAPTTVSLWDVFRTNMMGDPQYQKIAINVIASAQGNWLITTLQDVISMPEPSVSLFKPLWNQVIMLTIFKPLTTDVTRWQGYADAAGVSIKFLTNGGIQ